MAKSASVSRRTTYATLAASGLVVAAIGVLVLGLVTGETTDASSPSLIGILFMLTTVLLLLYGVRKRQDQVLHIDVFAFLAMALGVIIADSSGRIVLQAGSSVYLIAIPEVILYGAFYAAYLLVRARRLRPLGAPVAGNK